MSASQTKAAQATARLIKRYANRKMYDTERSCYVTLEEIAELVRDGVDVRVIDNTSKEDLTEVTLTQALLDSRRKNRQPVSLLGLKTLISQGGDNLQRNLVDSVTRARTDVERTMEKWKSEAERTVGRVLHRRADEGDEAGERVEAGTATPNDDIRGRASSRDRAGTEPAGGLEERLRRLIEAVGAASRRNDDHVEVLVERVAGLEARVAALEAAIEAKAAKERPEPRRRS